MSRHYVVTAHLCGAEPSGANRRLLNLLRELPAQLAPDERVTVLHGAELPETARCDGIDWRSCDLPAGPTWRRALAERRQLPRLLAELGADLVDLGALPVPSRLPCPAVLTIHDLRDLDRKLARHPVQLARFVLRRSLHRVAGVITPSEATATTLRRAVATPPPIQVVPGGVDLELFRPAPKPSRGYLLHVGHLEARKNLDTLIEAWATLPTDAGEPPLVLVGADAGAGHGLLTLADKLGVAGRLMITGAVGETRLREVYADAAAFAMPSTLEGFGLPALEALACGLTTLVADAGALPEVVGNQGVVLPAKDVDAWRTALAAALGDPPDAATIAARREHARQFSWARAATAWLATWRTAAG